MTAALLEVRDLTVRLHTSAGLVTVVDQVSLAVEVGQVLGLVGESGSGKSVTMRAVFGLLPRDAVIEGSVKLDGEELVGLPQRALRRYRGGRMAMIFQDPMTALNPVLTVGRQIAEAIRLHDPVVSQRDAMARAADLLDLVVISNPSRRVHQYPHEFSGGMRQRAVIAMAMANNPRLLVADEPTTALDVTVQAQIMDVLRKLRDNKGVGVILISHDLGLVAGTADHASVMYGGRVIEHGRVDDLFYRSRHPYTRGLLASLPKLDGTSDRLFAIGGAPPVPSRRPPGCAFHPRCDHTGDICSTIVPDLRPVDTVLSACHRAEEIEPADFAPREVVDEPLA